MDHDMLLKALKACNPWAYAHKCHEWTIPKKNESLQVTKEIYFVVRHLFDYSMKMRKDSYFVISFVYFLNFDLLYWSPWGIIAEHTWWCHCRTAVSFPRTLQHVARRNRESNYQPWGLWTTALPTDPHGEQHSIVFIACSIYLLSVYLEIHFHQADWYEITAALFLNNNLTWIKTHTEVWVSIIILKTDWIQAALCQFNIEHCVYKLVWFNPISQQQ